ncbi:MAG TPA: hypothetical protein VG268_10455 [Streptosporangiaceae bacterium]|nr:hypothetical protein [Streptosporangiaceae bacterium]
MPDDDPRSRERRDFRAWVRAHHPDAGGDPDSFVAGLAAWRQRRGQPSEPGPARTEVTVFRSRHGMWRLARWWRRHHGTRRVH